MIGSTRLGRRLLHPLALAPVALALASISAISAQEHANVQRGFVPEKVYAFDDVDSVNLFNGNLSLTIPIGGTYPVNGSLGYGLTLVYNSNIWDFHVRLLTDPLTGEVFSLESAVLSPFNNAGAGWSLSLGKLYAPTSLNNPDPRPLYVAEDGSHHRFYSSLHVGDSGFPSSSFSYSRDGSYLRVHSFTALHYELELPDGTIKKFTRSSPSDELELTEIRDRFNNKITITYPNPFRWDITDGHRTHKVYFESAVADGLIVNIVDRVELVTFNGEVATWDFSYETKSFDRHCSDIEPMTSLTLQAPFLTSITLPDGSAWRMDQPEDYLLTCVDNGPGVLARLKLPTLGTLAWTWRNYNYPSWNAEEPIGHNIVDNYGVATKRALDPDGACPTSGCEWTYIPEWFQTNHRKTTVVMPTGDQVVHHFNQTPNFNSSTFDGWQYGLPIHPTESDGQGRFLSQEVFTGTTKVRSIYLRYERDKLFEFPVFSSDWYDTNRRVVSEKTVFHDDGDRFSETTFSNFDGVGNYRTATTSGSFDAGNSRTTTTFTPERGTYAIDPATNDPTAEHSFVPWPLSRPWVLGTYVATSQTENGATARQEHCFETNGFLLRERTLSGTAASATDVIKLNTRDAAGNRIREQWFGGDGADLGTGDLCDVTLPATNSYRVDHTYTAGVLATSRWFDGAGDALPFFIQELVIDPFSGLPSKSNDVAGLFTDLTYDPLGRLTAEKPEEGAWVEYVYTPATEGPPIELASVHTRHRLRGNTTGTPLAEQVHRFDGFGRLIREEQKLPGGSFSRRDFAYNALGRRLSASERSTATPTHRTHFLEHDPFGRPRRIRPPDGASHDVVLQYEGTRRVTRTAKVATSATLETSVSTTETYDRQGRLFKVEESPTAGRVVTTTYQYDVGNRLSQVTMSSVAGTAPPTTQNRFFTYDRRGFLLSERHPEKGASGGGTTHYCDYDARGNARRRHEGGQHCASGTVQPFDLRFTYDRAERLTSVNHQGHGLLKQLEYYGANNARGRGKLRQATRHNRVDLGQGLETFTVTETYIYGGTAGRVSQRDTAVSRAGSSALTFKQTFGYNDLGDVVGLGYPCRANAAGACLPQEQRTVSYGYSNGRVTSVPGFASSITYHGNGALNVIQHSNGIVFEQGKDPNDMQRPLTIGFRLTPSSGLTSLAYTYDGSGNIKELGDEDYVYDGLSRVVSGRLGTGDTQIYAYDGFGNLTSITRHVDPSDPNSEPQTRNLPTSATTNHLTSGTYDAAGNLLFWNGNTFAWDGAGMITSYAGSGNQVRYLYTADDERIGALRLDGSDPGHIWSLRGLDGKVLRQFRSLLPPGSVFADGFESGDLSCWSDVIGGLPGLGPCANLTLQRDYVYREGLLLASVDPVEGTLHYLLDHLGSPRLVANSASPPTFGVRALFPFGEAPGPATGPGATAPMVFTGHERDFNQQAGSTPEQDDIDYMHARYCWPVLGRFLSIDPSRAAVEPKKPLTWNRYAYALNNPLKYVDPNGQDWWPVYGTFDPGSGSTVALSSSEKQEFLKSFGEGSVTGLQIIAGILGTKSMIGATSQLVNAVRAARLAAAIRSGKIVAGPAGAVFRSALENAATAGGSTVTVLTRQTVTLSASSTKPLFVAAGQGAEALTSIARPSGQLFAAKIPSALVDLLEKVALLQLVWVTQSP